MSITWEGAFIEARTVAGVIENTRKLLAASAKEATGIAYNVVMHGIDWGEHEASFHFVLLSPVSPERKP